MISASLRRPPTILGSPPPMIHDLEKESRHLRALLNLIVCGLYMVPRTQIGASIRLPQSAAYSVAASHDIRNRKERKRGAGEAERDCGSMRNMLRVASECNSFALAYTCTSVYIYIYFRIHVYTHTCMHIYRQTYIHMP